MESQTAASTAPRLAPEAFAERAQTIEREVGRVIVGQRDLVRQTLTGLLANSHVLLEGVPGLGKTMLVRTIADVIDCTFNRIQFTPDLMPADITGHEHPHRGGRPARLPVPAGSDLREPRPRRRDQPGDAQDPVEPARGDAGAPGHGRPPALPARAAVLRPRHAEPARDGGDVSRSPRPSSTGSCSRSWSPSRPRRTSSRSWTGRPAPSRSPPTRSARPPRSSRCSGSRGPCRSRRTSPPTR